MTNQKKVTLICVKNRKRKFLISCIRRDGVKYYISLALFFFLSTTFFHSCTNSDDTVLGGINVPFPKVTHLAMQTERDGKWGLIDIGGKMLFENEFDTKPSYAVNGVFRIKEFDAKRQIEVLKYYLATRNPKQIGEIEGYVGGGMCSEGIIPVVPYGGRIHYINTTGETVFCLQPYKGKEIYIVSPFFSDQRAWFMLEDSKYGFIDPQGNIVIEPIYDNAYPFHEGKAIVYDKGRDRYIVIDVDGNELFEINANRLQNQCSLFYGGYCVIGDSLYNEQGEGIHKMPIYYNSSPFKYGVALFQDSETYLWKQVNKQGFFVGETQCDMALGMIDSITYVGNTKSIIMNEKGVSQYVIDAYALDRYGKIQNKFEGVSRFFPLYNNIVVEENDKCYFADKYGTPINNESYAKIAVPLWTHAPGYPCMWSFLWGPDHPDANYRSGGVGSSYFDDQKTVGSILEKLTNEGFGQLKIGQKISEIDKMRNKKSKRLLKGWAYNVSVEYGINRVRAICSVYVAPPGVVIAIGVKLDTSSLPIGRDTQRIPTAIEQCIEGSFIFEKDPEQPHLYHSKFCSYDIEYVVDKNLLLLLGKS